MSKANKANKSNYIQAGRLTADELAREYKKQTDVASGAKSRQRTTAKDTEPRVGRGGKRARMGRKESD
jgi:hypothetical protein